MPVSVQDEQRVWGRNGSLEFFQKSRQRPEDLYPSERFFLPAVLPQVTSCLDVGCAAGGFSRIMKSFNPSLRYTGIDILPEFVDIARRAHPDSQFLVGDGIHFTTPPESYDLVFSTGILHLNSRYRDIVDACYAQARRFLLCDFRLTRGAAVTGTFHVKFSDGNETPLPYVVLNVDEAVTWLASLTPRPRRIRAYGYYHAPSAMASVPLTQVLMAFFLVEKGPMADTTDISLELPDGS